MFGGTAATAVPELALQDVPPWPDKQRLAFEKEMLGFYVTGHPLGEYAPLMRRYVDTLSTEIEGKQESKVRVGGLLGSFREIKTRKGQAMAFASLEDLDGVFELVIFPEPYAHHLSLLKAVVNPEAGAELTPLLVSGILVAATDPPKVKVEKIWKLEDAGEQLSSQLRIRLGEKLITKDRLLALKNLLAGTPGRCEIVLHVVIPGQSETMISVHSVEGVNPTDDLLHEIDVLFGTPVTKLVI